MKYKFSKPITEFLWETPHFSSLFPHNPLLFFKLMFFSWKMIVLSINQNICQATNLTRRGTRLHAIFQSFLVILDFYDQQRFHKEKVGEKDILQAIIQHSSSHFGSKIHITSYHLDSVSRIFVVQSTLPASVHTILFYTFLLCITKWKYYSKS